MSPGQRAGWPKSPGTAGMSPGHGPLCPTVPYILRAHSTRGCVSTTWDTPHGPPDASLVCVWLLGETRGLGARVDEGLMHVTCGAAGVCSRRVHESAAVVQRHSFDQWTGRCVVT